MTSPYALDFNPLSQALESNQQADFTRNRLAMEQRRLGMAEESHGWERQLQPTRLEGAQLDVRRNRETLPYDVRVKAADAAGREQTNRFESQLQPLRIQGAQLGNVAAGQGIEKTGRELEKDLYGRAAAVGQLVENERDPERRKALLQRWYQQDPTIRKYLGTTLPKELLDDPETITKYLRAVSQGYQAPQIQKVGKDETLVGVTRNPNDPAATPVMAELYKNPGKGEEFKGEHQLRQELAQNPTIKNFSEVRAGYSKVIDGKRLGTGAGDISIVFGFMKMLDPTSVVREGEYATAANATGVPDRIRLQYEKLLNGEQLPPRAREEILAAAAAHYGTQQGEVAKINRQYTDIATRNNLNPANVILDHGMANPPGGPARDDRPASPFSAPPPPVRGRFTGPPSAPPPAAPPPGPVAPAGANPPENAVRYLLENHRSNPGIIREFEQKYGPGSALRYLGTP